MKTIITFILTIVAATVFGYDTSYREIFPVSSGTPMITKTFNSHQERGRVEKYYIKNQNTGKVIKLNKRPIRKGSTIIQRHVIPFRVKQGYYDILDSQGNKMKEVQIGAYHTITSIKFLGIKNGEAEFAVEGSFFTENPRVKIATLVNDKYVLFSTKFYRVNKYFVKDENSLSSGIIRLPKQYKNKVFQVIMITKYGPNDFFYGPKPPTIKSFEVTDNSESFSYKVQVQTDDTFTSITKFSGRTHALIERRNEFDAYADENGIFEFEEKIDKRSKKPGKHFIRLEFVDDTGAITTKLMSFQVSEDETISETQSK